MLYFKTYFSIKVLFLNLLALVKGDVLPSLPYCPESNGLGLLLVSTLDGRLSALSSNGSLAWQIETGPGPLLVSNIHKLELTNNGEWVRIIPSLTGTLYKFDGNTVDPIPISAEELLKSSFRYSDDLVIAGGIEVRTYGVGFKTGTLYYECTSQRCSNSDNQNVDDLLLIERNTHIIRAVEPRSGTERWNFSVGLHNAKLHRISCIDMDLKLYDWNLTAIVPEGKLRALITYNGIEEQNWQYIFPSPIVRVWRWTGNTLSEVNLFIPRNVPVVVSDDPVLPSIYIGMHNRQLYIHESAEMQRILRRKPTADVVVVESTGLVKILWKPIPASTQTIEDDSTALSVLNESEYVNGHGFYLYTEMDPKKKDKAICSKNVSFVRKLLPAKIKVDFLPTYFSWKEIFILLLTFIVCHLAFRYFHAAHVNSEPVELNLPMVRRTSENNESFSSRYENDFIELEHLGKGGFGIVLKVKQKFDEFEYAVKIIPLPNRKEEKDRVMREVRALAKLHHANIVRYCNCWVDLPPKGWLNRLESKRIGGISISENYSETGSDQNQVNNNITSEKTNQYQDDDDDDDSSIVFEKDETANPCEKESLITSTSSQESQEITETRFNSKRPTWKHHSLHSEVQPVYLYIQMELCQKDSLQKWLENNPKRDYQFVLDIFTQILQAVEYVHLRGLIHRDLKPSNILFSLDGRIKIGDFGLVKDMEETVDLEVLKKGATPLNKGHTSEVGTRNYASPEQYQSCTYDYKVDIYSLGLIFFELLYPFGSMMEKSKVFEGLKKNVYPPKFIEEYAEPHCLLQEMLCENPNKRLTTIGIRARPPFNQRDEQYGDEYHYKLNL